MENLLGVMRLGVVCLWMWLIRSRTETEIVLTKGLIPILGCVNVLFSLLGLVVPMIKPHFWENNRMSGIFQYANTNALFLAVGIIFLIYHWKKQKKWIYGG